MTVDKTVGDCLGSARYVCFDRVIVIVNSSVRVSPVGVRLACRVSSNGRTKVA